VDTGFGGESFNRLRSLGVGLDRIDVVLLTHMHRDHIGGLTKGGEPLFPNARVYIPQRDLEHFTKTAVSADAVAAITPYQAQSRVQTFQPSELEETMSELLPGITPIAAYGHTPGHTVFLIESEGERFFIIGDIVHVAPVQFPCPEITVIYDVDKSTAAASRLKILNYVARNEIPISGVHIAPPGNGTVQSAGNGFSFTPAAC